MLAIASRTRERSQQNNAYDVWPLLVCSFQEKPNKAFEMNDCDNNIHNNLLPPATKLTCCCFSRALVRARRLLRRAAAACWW